MTAACSRYHLRGWRPEGCKLSGQGFLPACAGTQQYGHSRPIQSVRDLLMEASLRPVTLLEDARPACPALLLPTLSQRLKTCCFVSDQPAQASSLIVACAIYVCVTRLRAEDRERRIADNGRWEWKTQRSVWPGPSYSRRSTRVHTSGTGTAEPQVLEWTRCSSILPVQIAPAAKGTLMDHGNDLSHCCSLYDQKKARRTGSRPLALRRSPTVTVLALR